MLVGAGDIAGCPTNFKDEATAKLLDGIAGTVFTLGDNVYEDGTVHRVQELLWDELGAAPGTHPAGGGEP